MINKIKHKMRPSSTNLSEINFPMQITYYDKQF